MLFGETEKSRNLHNNALVYKPYHCWWLNYFPFFFFSPILMKDSFSNNVVQNESSH